VILNSSFSQKKKKKLVLLFSKALLRHPMAKSDFSEMKEGTRFLRFIPESNKDLKG